MIKGNSGHGTILAGDADIIHVYRRWWADYFESQGIRYTFFSAALAAKQQEEERLAQEKKEMEEALKAEKQSSEEDDDDDDEEEEESGEQNATDSEKPAEEQKDKEDDTQHISEALSDTKLSESKEPVDERIRVRTTTNLLDLLIDETPKGNIF